MAEIVPAIKTRTHRPYLHDVNSGVPVELRPSICKETGVCCPPGTCIDCDDTPAWIKTVTFDNAAEGDHGCDEPTPCQDLLNGTFQLTQTDPIAFPGAACGSSRDGQDSVLCSEGPPPNYLGIILLRAGIIFNGATGGVYAEVFLDTGINEVSFRSPELPWKPICKDFEVFTTLPLYSNVGTGCDLDGLTCEVTWA
jgi:hypothetical protein